AADSNSAKPLSPQTYVTALSRDPFAGFLRLVPSPQNPVLVEAPQFQSDRLLVGRLHTSFDQPRSIQQLGKALDTGERVMRQLVEKLPHHGLFPEVQGDRAIVPPVPIRRAPGLSGA